MRQTLRVVGIGFLSLVSLETLVGILDWVARWDWFSSVILNHPHFAVFVRTPFSYLALILMGFAFLWAEREIKEPKLVGRYTNSRTIPDLKTATMKMLFDSERKAPGWDDARCDWDWFVEIQMANASETPTTVDQLKVKITVGPKWGKKRLAEFYHLEDLDRFEIDFHYGGAGKQQNKPHVGERIQPIPSFMERIRDRPLESEINHRGWLHFKVKQISQREINTGEMRLDIWLIDALQRRHKIQFEKNSDRKWESDFYITGKTR